MKQFFIPCVVLGGALSLTAAEPVRRLVLTDESRARIHYYDSSDPAKCFWLEAEKTNWDLQPVGVRTPGQIGRYRFLCRNGFKVVDLDARRTVDEFRHPALKNLSSLSDLPDGGFIAAINPGGRRKAILVRRFSKDRRLVCTTAFPGIHNCRMMQRLANGDLILAHETGFSHVRLPAGDRDQDGLVVRSGRMPHARNMFHALPTRDGTGYWGGAGYAAEVVRFDGDGRALRTFSAPPQDGLKSYFYGQIKEMTDARLLISNWTGHRPNDSKKGWQLLEFDSEGKVTWSLYDPKRYGSIHGFFELEGPGLPLVDATAAWSANPRGWTIDRVAEALRATGGAEFAVADTTRAAETEYRVRVTPEAVGANGRAALGLSLYDGEGDFWHVALVHTPSERGPAHGFELCERRGGRRQAQTADGLVCTERRTTGTWAFGETYDLVLKTTPAGIRGEVKQADGRTLFVCAYAFRTAAGPAKAVTCGRLALHATGAFRGVFAQPAAVTAQPCPAGAGETGN